MRRTAGSYDQYYALGPIYTRPNRRCLLNSDHNVGPVPTSCAVGVADALPAGFTATGISGLGWTCVLSTAGDGPPPSSTLIPASRVRRPAGRPSIKLIGGRRAPPHRLRPGLQDGSLWPVRPPLEHGYSGPGPSRHPIHAISQGIDTNASNPASRLMLTILAGVAEFECEIICERTLVRHAAGSRGRQLDSE